MTHIERNPLPGLRKVLRPPLSYRVAIPDLDRAHRPRLTEPTATGGEMDPGDCVEGLEDFGNCCGISAPLSERPQGRE